MVVTSPQTSPSATWQERTASPSIWTVQAPQAATPQPYLVPVRFSASRSTQSRGTSSGRSTSCAVPLTVSVAGIAASSCRVRSMQCRRTLRWRQSQAGLTLRPQAGGAPAARRSCRLAAPWAAVSGRLGWVTPLPGVVVCGGCSAVSISRREEDGVWALRGRCRAADGGAVAAVAAVWGIEAGGAGEAAPASKRLR